MNYPVRSFTAHQALKQAYQAGYIVFFTDPRVLAREGSPIYHPFDVFGPPVILLAGSLIILFAMGLFEWIVTLVLVLACQLYGGGRFLHWRVHERAVEAVLKNPHNLQVLWRLGGLAVALKDYPDQICVSPEGDWVVFCEHYLMAPPEPVETGEES